ncbi:hypothetical protein [Cyanobium sp. ATX 6F1]|uniref:hypothetical protein n=1 Tax=unclassified Cyanobium TaxID=2627006 RepID=UPI0020CEA679|nr:hypothetical protein [Cyanobium sp. ATX 6F1]MCP9915894.1 hypothetical protein [Cyanobium sp. ATX 6F1]
MPDLSIYEAKWQEKCEEHINAFGDMLLVWRQSNGWSSQTLQDWAHNCPELLPIKLLNSVLTGLELKLNKNTDTSTFQALGMANVALSEDFRGAIRDRVLHERIYNAKPICHQNGKPWTPGDFFRAFIGELAIPEAYKPSLLDPDDDVLAMEAEEARGRFHALRKAEGLMPVAGFMRLMRPTPSTELSIRERIESVLLGEDSFAERDAGAILLCERLLGSWERELEADGSGKN